MAGITCPSCGALQPAASPGTQCYACGSALAEEDNLPAPVARQNPIDLPAPRFGGPDGIDLPAPKQRPPLAPPSLTPPPIDNLPAPRGHAPQPPAAVPDDLPAPVNRANPPRQSLPPRPPPEMPDLLAPRGALPPPVPDDLPAPRGHSAPGQLPDNLPAPRGHSAAPGQLPDNLPAPRGHRPPPGSPIAPPPLPSNLPAPAKQTQQGIGTELQPMRPGGPPPSGNSDLPTPVGQHPTNSLPAPKGFFDDGVAPASDPMSTAPSTLPAPKGFFDDGVVPRTDGGQVSAPNSLPAPKGFFDDGVAPTPDEGPRGGALPAPKGFFDDVDEVGAAGARPLDMGSEPQYGSEQLEAPLDLGEPLDLGGAAASSKPSLDLDGLDLAGGPASPPQGAPIDLGAPLEQRPFGLDELDLEAPKPERAESRIETSPFEDIGLATTTSAGPSPLDQEPPSLQPPSGDGVVSFTRPSDSAVAEGQQAMQRRRPRPSDGPLELDRSALPHELDAPKTVAPKRRVAVEEKKPSRKRTVAMVAVLAVLGLGAGGYYGYDKWTSGKTAGDKVDRHLEAARAAMAKNNPGHWMAAAGAAKKALQADRKNIEALALSAQGHFAAAIDEGVDADARSTGGKKAVNELRKLAATGPEVDKAEALMAVIERRPDDALKRLVAAKNGAPRDPDLRLYFGWAYMAGRDWDKAASSFADMLKVAPGRVAAKFGLAEALLALDKRDEARKAYGEVIAEYRDKYKRDHVGALVGAAQLAEVEKFSEREERYKEILNRKEYVKADPRAISKVGALAGFEALRAGRIQEASQLFAAAIRLNPENVSAVVGEGEVLLAQGRLDDARERLSRVRKVDPSNYDAALALAAVAIKQESLTEAKELLKSIFERKPPISDSRALARAHRIRARVYALEPGMIGKVEGEFRKAMELSGENGIDGALELARFLVSQEREEDARAVLEPIKARAAKDPSIAVSLGVAYLGAGDPVTAEQAFRSALAQRANDVEAKYQLGAALLAQKRADEGLAAIKAAYNTDRTREDIGVALAVAYEERKRFEDAEALYESLLKSAEPTLNVKARAGRYFARYGIDRARDQARYRDRGGDAAAPRRALPPRREGVPRERLRRRTAQLPRRFGARGRGPVLRGRGPRGRAPEAARRRPR